MNLLDFATEDDFETDDYNEEFLANKAHRIIYKSIYEKLNGFLTNKDRLKTKLKAFVRRRWKKINKKLPLITKQCVAGTAQ